MKLRLFNLAFFVCFAGSAFAQLPLRIAADAAVRKSAYIPDLNNNSASLSFVRGDDVTVEIGLFENGRFLTNISSFTNLACQIFTSQNSTNGPLMAQSVTNGTTVWNPIPSYAGWITNSGPDTNWHVQFYFPGAQTSVPLNGQPSQTYWLRVAAETTNSRVLTFLEGPVTIYDGPISPDYVAPAFPLSLAVDQFVKLYPPQTNFFAVNSNLLNQSVNNTHGSGGGGGSSSYDPAVIGTNAASQITVAGTLSNINAQLPTPINGGDITNIPVASIVGAPSTNIIKASTTLTPDSIASAPQILIAAPDFTNHLVGGGVPFSNSFAITGAFASDHGQVSTDGGGDLTVNGALNAPDGLFTGNASVFGNGQIYGLGETVFTGGTTNYGKGFFGNGPGLTNLQSTNVVIVSSTNDVTATSLLGGTNWAVLFNRDYWTFVSNNICISNCQGLLPNADNWVNIFFRVTNSSQTIYISWAPWPSGSIPILSGFTNSWPLVYSQGYYHLCGHIFGTNWATNAEWELTNPSL